MRGTHLARAVADDSGGTFSAAQELMRGHSGARCWPLIWRVTSESQCAPLPLFHDWMGCCVVGSPPPAPNPLQAERPYIQ